MKILVQLLICTSLFSSLAHADSAATVSPLPLDEFKRIAGERDVKMNEATKAVILKIATAMDPLPPQVASLVEAIRSDAKTVTLESLMPIMDREHGQLISQNLKTHDDPVIRFVANLILTASGDSNASTRLHSLIHDESLPLTDKRLIRTWCSGVGIRVATDDAHEILVHLTTAMSGKPKFKKGDVAPEFDTKTVNGIRLSSAQLRGKVIVLHFWSTSCGPCMSQMPSHVTLLSPYDSDNVEIVFVSLDEDEEAFNAAVSKFGISFHNVREASGWGGNLTRAFGINAIPFDVVIGRDGKVFSNSIEDINAALAATSTPAQGEGRPKR